MTEEKKQLAKDLLKRLISWQAKLSDLYKEFDEIESQALGNFGGHLVKGYITNLDARVLNIYNLLNNVFEKE